MAEWTETQGGMSEILTVGDENHENGLVSGAIAGREQDHRGIKGRYRPMRGFKCPRSAARFCCAYDELRNFLRPRSRLHQHVPPIARDSSFSGGV